MKTLLFSLLLILGIGLVTSCEKQDIVYMNTFKAEVGNSIIRTHGTEGLFPEGSIGNWGNDNYPIVEAKAESGVSVISVNGENIYLDDKEFKVIYRR